jgi:probable rRNA maturation factor
MLEVVLLNRQRRQRIDASRLRRLLEGAASSLRVSGELALVFTSDRVLRRLNSRYRGKDAATDVLSFPGGRETGLGDIVISVDSAARNARGRGRTVRQELDALALHGFLHLLGYDHETDDGTMRRLERRMLRLRSSARQRRRPSR